MTFQFHVGLMEIFAFIALVLFILWAFSLVPFR
jgi:hypothetical protein